jgi:6-phospho-3-hexuloisomerase
MEMNYLKQITTELSEVVAEIDSSALTELSSLIKEAKRVYLVGAGRSGLMMRCLAMRLMHLGLTAYVVGDTTTPGIAEKDLLIIGSGSGETRSMLLFAQEAKKRKANLALFTIFEDSAIGNLADVIVKLNTPTSKKANAHAVQSIQPMGNLFEQTLLIVADALVMELMRNMNITGERMMLNHANLE